MQGDGGFPALSQAVRVALASAAALTPPQLNALPAENRLLIHAARQDAALQMAVAQQALANSSGRFTALQSLIGAIAAAPDQKAILDLQARIGAELGMLQNEQTKLQILLGAGAAQAAIDRQHEFVQAVAAQGLFASRFQPVP